MIRLAATFLIKHARQLFNLVLEMMDLSTQQNVFLLFGVSKGGIGRVGRSFDAELAKWIDIGASPRASLALDRCARVHAWLAGRDYVDPEDVRAIAPDVLRHRLALSYEAQGSGVSADQVSARVLSVFSAATMRSCMISISAFPFRPGCG